MERTSKLRFKVIVIENRCKECGICIDKCPVKILKKGEGRNIYGYKYTVVEDQAKCLGCRTCEYFCPELAIYVEEVANG